MGLEVNLTMKGTLLLTSAGIKIPPIGDELLKLLKKPNKRIKVAHIITASKAEKDTWYVDDDNIAMEKLDFNVELVDIRGKNESSLRKILGNKDIVYVQGGNSYYLLKHIKASGFDKVVKELVTKGTIYVGVSSGTYVSCPTIEMQTWINIGRNRYGLKDLKALNLVPHLITVHFNRAKYSEGLKDGIKKTKLPVRILTDYQAILVKNGKSKYVGVGKEIKQDDVIKDNLPSDDKIHMEMAIYSALQSKKAKLLPLGAVVVKNSKYISNGSSLAWPKKDPVSHPEIEAMRNACQKFNSLDLSECTLYTTLEPCSMCLSAASWSNIKKVVFGAYKKDVKGNPYEIRNYDAMEHAKKLTPLNGGKIEIKGGVLRYKCKALMKNYKNWQYGK